MKRTLLALGISAAALAISTPASAQTGCRWYDVNCRLANGGRTGGTVDSSWQLIGHDANGNAIYQRRRVDGNGNVVIERARRDALGRLIIIDRNVDNRNVLNSTRYGVNGQDCRYRENARGYKTECKYAKTKPVKGLYRADKVKGGKKGSAANVNGIYGTTVRGGKYKAARGSSPRNDNVILDTHDKPDKHGKPSKGGRH
jgi:hypothetical protein